MAVHTFECQELSGNYVKLTTGYGESGGDDSDKSPAL